jgi:hypothetical protein
MRNKKEVIITMWPIVTYTSFTSGDVRTGGDNPQLLLDVPWEVEWAITKNAGNENGLEPLINAQKAILGDENGLLLVTGKRNFIGRRDGTDNKSTTVAGTTTGPKISFRPEVDTYEVVELDNPYAVNFNLDYVPFNITAPADWAEYVGESYLDLSTGGPVWVIRNGLNDLPMDENTTFDPAQLGPRYKDNNVNGAVLASVKRWWNPNPEPWPPQDTPPGDLADDNPFLYGGEYNGPDVDPTRAKISFRTAGYRGNAKIYYAIVSANTGGYTSENATELSPDLLPYVNFKNYFNDLRGTGGPHREVVDIGVDLTTPPDDIFQVWLVLVTESGEVSNRIVITIDDSLIVVQPAWDEKEDSPSPTES